MILVYYSVLLRALPFLNISSFHFVKPPSNTLISYSQLAVFTRRCPGTVKILFAE